VLIGLLFTSTCTSVQQKTKIAMRNIAINLTNTAAVYLLYYEFFISNYFSLKTNTLIVMFPTSITSITLVDC
jgi:hypothetical protein